MSKKIAIVWFRRDLRLADNPALDAARNNYEQVLPVYIHAPAEEGDWAPGGASKWWLHHSLSALAEELRDRDSGLIIGEGKSLEQLKKLVKSYDAAAVYWNRLYDPLLVERDKEVKAALKEEDLDVKSFSANLLTEPWEVQNGSGKPYQVFTPFWRQVQKQFEVREPLPKPRKLSSPKIKKQDCDIDALGLLPKINWDEGLKESWQPGSDGANELLREFLKNKVSSYKDERNRTDIDASSRLSPHLHFGEIGPHQIWHEVEKVTNAGADAPTEKETEAFLRQLAWRDFAHHLLFHFPHTDKKPLREEFAKFPWKKNAKALKRWQKGKTGYPLVDAGMRELWHTGVMHNRVRMVVASFLVKHLLQPWQAGEEWFWDTLVDADLANNSFGWQWTAGCGADAAPYFRVFNPILQGEKFDPKGKYTKKWVPELEELPNKWLQKPWEAPKDVLEEAGIELGKDYPKPIVEHSEAREKALEAYYEVKGD